MTDKILSALAFLTLLTFLGILFAWVPRLDLAVVLGMTVLLAGYDMLVRRKR
jgi:hypothetical protein